MRVPRRLQVLSVVASLAAASFGVPAGALAQSAGDEQYQDPLAGETQTQPDPSADPQAPNVDDVPQLSPSAGGTGSGATPPTTTAPTAPGQPLPSTLPNTGADGRILAGIGLGLLLCGVGLRLRTARERF